MRLKKTMGYVGMAALSMFSNLSNDGLLAETIRLAAHERLATGQLIAALAEVDARKLYLGQGCSSLFVYCTRVLHLSEHGAYARIEAARAARRFPAILGLLIEGALTLTSVTLLSPHLTDGNSRRHSTTRHVPASIRRAVWRRDAGACAFVGNSGRCGERGFLEFHHREPFAAGPPTTVENLELRCRAHNGYEADLFFRPWTVREQPAEFEDATWS